MKTKLLTLVFALFSFSVFSQNDDVWVNPPIGCFGFERYWDEEKSLYGYQKDGKVVIDATYIWVEGFTSKGLARVRKFRDETSRDSMSRASMYIFNPGLDGFIDTLGNVIVPIEFGIVGLLDHFSVAEFTRGKQIRYNNGTELGRSEKYGLINDKGEIVLEPMYDYIKPYVYSSGFISDLFIADIFIYCEDGEKTVKTLWLTNKGEVLAPNGKYDFMESINHMENKCFFYVEKQGMAGIINDLLEVVLPLEYKVTDSETTKKRLVEIYYAKKKVVDSLSQEKEKIVQ